MVEGTGLENRRGVKATVGSNPTLSAIEKHDHLVVFFYASETVLRANGRHPGGAYHGLGEA